MATSSAADATLNNGADSDLDVQMTAQPTTPAAQPTGPTTAPTTTVPPGLQTADPMAQMMFLLQQLIAGMPANIAAAINTRPSNHLDNVKLDIRSFSRIKSFTNKHDAWKEWENQFLYVIYECDNSFGDFISNLEKR